MHVVLIPKIYYSFRQPHLATGSLHMQHCIESNTQWGISTPQRCGTPIHKQSMLSHANRLAPDLGPQSEHHTSDIYT